MIWKAPYRLPNARRVVVTRGFGATTEPMDPVGPHGEPHFHYGVDITFGDDRQSYGVPLVLPFPSARLIEYHTPEMGSTQSSFAKFRYRSASGNTYDLVLVHVQEIVFQAPYTLGDVVAYTGNVGKVFPKPSIGNPWDGAHLHLGLQRNGVWVDPLDWFDLWDCFIGEADAPEKDVPALQWALQSARALLAKLLGSK